MYKVIFLAFTVIGAAAALGPVILFADSIFFLMAVFNVTGLYFLARIIRREFTQYWGELKRGELELAGQTVT